MRHDQFLMTMGDCTMAGVTKRDRTSAASRSRPFSSCPACRSAPRPASHDDDRTSAASRSRPEHLPRGQAGADRGRNFQVIGNRGIDRYIEDQPARGLEEMRAAGRVVEVPSNTLLGEARNILHTECSAPRDLGAGEQKTLRATRSGGNGQGPAKSMLCKGPATRRLCEPRNLEEARMYTPPDRPRPDGEHARRRLPRLGPARSMLCEARLPQIRVGERRP